MEKDLEDTLKACEKSALIGYKIATNQYKALKSTLANAQEEIQNTLTDFQTSPCYVSGATEMLSEQLIDIESSFNNLSFAFTEDLQNLRDNLPKFSVTLFGRTMAGKSTLMEILTHGDGKSIGLGAQRTTRDTRTYPWNGLEITDVPGIGAFEGKDDEDVAFNAAKTADLILFLITDDAPQAAEAECFRRIVNLGKPVICVMNVKVAMPENKSLKLSLRDIDKRFDMERLNAIRKQFMQYSNQMGQDWGCVPFVYVHLKSAFLAQNVNDAAEAESLNKASRIDFLKDKITEQVRSKGEFYRIKTFIDTISEPMLGSMEKLLDQSMKNSAQGRTILAKKRQLDTWKNGFERDGKTRIESLVTSIRSQLNAEIAAFAEEHYDDPKADKAWNQLIKDWGINIKCQNMLDDFEEQCNNKIAEVSREITNELRFASTYAMDKSLRMHSIVDGKRIWNWSFTIVGGGLTIATIITSICGAAITGPLGWIAIGVGIVGVVGSRFFSSREKKEEEARQKLEKSLKENVSKICASLSKQLHYNFDILLSKKINALMKEMVRMNSVVFRLADIQKSLAWRLDEHLLELNLQFISEALKMINADGLQYHILEVARIPGNAVVLMLNDGTVFPVEQKTLLKSLISENIGFVYNSDSKRVLISRVIGKSIDRYDIKLEEKIGVAHIPMGNLSPHIMNRVEMAKQLARVAIIDSEDGINVKNCRIHTEK